MVYNFEAWLKRDNKKNKTINIYIKFVKEYVEWYFNNKDQHSICVKREDLQEFVNLKESKRYSSSTIKVIISSVKKFNRFLIASDCNYESYL